MLKLKLLLPSHLSNFKSIEKFFIKILGLHNFPRPSLHFVHQGSASVRLPLSTPATVPTTTTTTSVIPPMPSTAAWSIRGLVRFKSYTEVPFLQFLLSPSPQQSDARFTGITLFFSLCYSRNRHPTARPSGQDRQRLLWVSTSKLAPIYFIFTIAAHSSKVILNHVCKNSTHCIQFHDMMMLLRQNRL